MNVIGRKDKIDFPELELLEIPVKIDSGAYSSSIHCSKIELKEKDGLNQLNVVFLDESYPSFTGKSYSFEKFISKKVKSSNGITDERFFIQLTVTIFGENYTSVFSLTQRVGLKNPVLLGRKLLNKRFLIDTSKTNLSFNNKAK